MLTRAATNRSPIVTRLAIATMLLSLNGCAAIYGRPHETDPNTPQEVENKQLIAQCAKDPDKRSCRDAIVYQRIRVIDRDFFEFANSVRVESTKLSLLTDLAVLGLSGAGATAPAAAPVLAAVAGGLTGAKEAIDKDTFYEKTMPALLAAMEAQRHEVMVKIETGLAGPIDKYDLNVALTDIESYRRAGSIDGALMQITHDAGETIAKADDQIAQVRKGSFLKDKAGDALRAFWKPDGKTIDKKNETALRDWMAKNDADGVSITFFLRNGNFKDARLKAARDLELPELGE